ncbi:LacI family transcriptional regulator [Streptomyces tanashiensis]|uniref:substrate-binding domain-containing protein n=1 Tax=Streptomyces tanashiensis TaxID=67367 RepID=UPI00167A2D7D|nr:substrate-binding domain-containing protein [Streptomyces tanashiensis]GGT14353.1 LacI family transcriptional regulator [Streptomyces tanashiensis]
MTITAEERRARILDVVRELGAVRVVDLAERLGFPAVTVRRDVATLSDMGLVQRSHGSVSMPPSGSSAAPALRPRVVGMLVPTVGSYFDEVIAGARSAAAGTGARLVLGVAAYGASDDRAQVEQLMQSDVDGLLITPDWTVDAHSEGCAWLRDLPVPVVLVERRAAAGSACAELDGVSSDHRHGVLLALRHLASSGHGSVLLAARTDTWTAHQVRAGYEEGVRLLGLEPQPVIDIPHPGADPDSVAARIAEGAAAGVRAVLVHNDRDAIQLTPLLRTRGLDVPEDVVLVSYDDVFAALAAPPLTAVAPPKRAVGAAALDLLLHRLDGGSSLPTHHVELLPELKIRASSGGTP